MMAARGLSMGLAGTDFVQHRHFVTAAEDYRRGIQRVLNNDIAEHQRPGQTYLAGQALWNQVPAFAYRPPDARWVLARHRSALVVLAAWLTLAVVAMLRHADTALVD